MSFRLAFNILAICGTAVFTGVMLNIGLTLGAYWKSLAPTDFLDWFSRNSGLIGRTIPLVAGPALVGLVGSLWFGWSTTQERLYWLTALASAAGIAAITIAYHLPANATFAAKTVAVSDVPAKLDQWLALHWVRIGLGFVSAIAGVLAVSA
ncbi:MAG TPA: anthrone oxygenase family protein [Bauldia sp.]|nr:anthrone oxygenase family protein [Bauldia sp.]